MLWVCSDRMPNPDGSCECGHRPHVRIGNKITCDECNAQRIKEQGPSIQDVVNTGMTAELIRDVVNGIAKGVRVRATRDTEDLRAISISLLRIADALEYLVALSRLQQAKGPNA
jgi:hypothetical protein